MTGVSFPNGVSDGLSIYSGVSLIGGVSFVGVVAPVITAGPTWTDNADGTATITWTTDIASDSTLNYGLTVAYGSTVTDASLVTSHSLTTSTLAAVSTYHFDVVSVATGGTVTSSDDTGTVTYTTPLLGASYGDSRADISGTIVGPNMYDGNLRNTLNSLTNISSFYPLTPREKNDYINSTNGGVSGELSGNWNSGVRSGGKTIGAVLACTWDVIFIQYATNDANGVTSTATRDSVATAAISNLQALITFILNDATNPNRKVIFQTTYQRTSAGYGGPTNDALRRDCCDYINYGNGGAITGMTAWIQGHALYNTRLYIHDVSTLLNVGGAQTGAYVDGTWFGDGIHPSAIGGKRIATSYAAFLSTIYPYRGIPTLYRSTGPNLIPDVSASYYGGEVLTNCSKGTITYATDSSGRKYGEVTITPNNVTAGSYKFELLPDVGTNGGRTPAGGTFAVNDLLMPRVLLTIDDGSGGAPVVNNVATFFFCSYIGGVPALQQIQTSALGQGTVNYATAVADGQFITEPLKMTGDSSLIGAPAGGSGLRLFIQIYFPITPTPFRVRWTSPEVRKVV